MHEGHGVLPMRIASLPLAHLYDTVVLLGGPDHDVAFRNTVAQWFLAIDILACLASVDGLEAMPMVGRTDDHDIDVLIVDHLSPILVQVFYFLSGDFGGLGRPVLEDIAVDVAQGDASHFRIAEKRFKILKSHTVAADKSDTDLVVGADMVTGLDKKRAECHSGADKRRLFQEISTGCHVFFSSFLKLTNRCMNKGTLFLSYYQICGSSITNVVPLFSSERTTMSP